MAQPPKGCLSWLDFATCDCQEAQEEWQTLLAEVERLRADAELATVAVDTARKLQAEIERLREDSKRLDLVLKECLIETEREPRFIITSRKDIDRLKGGERGDTLP